MRDYLDDPSVSVVEDLDPVPDDTGGRRYWRELILGLLLIVGVLAWSGWQWEHQQNIQSHYFLAQDAAGHLSLDTALREYQAADEYRDARSRAAELSKQLVIRDTQYAAAVEALRLQQWAASLKAIRAVGEVQPNYRNINTLRVEAERHVYRESVMGSIALRTRVAQPGLYYRSSSGWVLLEGSDRWSKIRGTGDARRVIYDIPGPGWQPGSAPAPQGDQGYGTNPAGSPDLAGRKLMVATIKNDTLTFDPLVFDPAGYNVFEWGNSGVWALRNHPDMPSPRTSSPLPGYSDFYDIAYQAFGATVTSTVSVPTPDWFVTDLAADGNHLLLAQVNKIDGQQSLHVSGPEGFDRRLVYSTTGQITTAFISHDGRYVIVGSETSVKGSVNARRELSLIDLDKRQTYLLHTEDIKSESYSYIMMTRAGFVSGGPYAGWILLLKPAGIATTLQIIDPAHPDKPAVQVELNPTSRDAIESVGLVFASSTADNKLMLAMQRNAGVNLYSPGKTSLLLLQAGPDGKTTTSALALGAGEFLSDFQVTGDSLVYATTTGNGPGSVGSDSAYRVRSLPLTDIMNTLPQPATVLSGTTSSSPSGSSGPGGAYIVGRSLLAYLEGNQLHVRSYDASVDVPLENGVEMLYDSSRSHNQFWLH